MDRYKKVTRGTNNVNLEQLIERVLTKQSAAEASVKDLADRQVVMQKKTIEYFQKSTLIRFNPFEDAGGDQSFVAALLDGRDSGFIISSLHSRSGTRVYAKAVTSGKSTYSLTREEKEALDRATRAK